ncbi:hypothetical protein APHAL10511_000090 [Amanita phalloides]|nr:hypothetical protein APHAL10511_000090 [Amanita phalloides]
MQVPVLVNFLNDVPLPLTAVLVHLAPHFACLRSLAHILSWKSPWHESWLLIALWWSTCLLGDSLLRYMLPFLIILGALQWNQNQPARPNQALVTEATLQNIVSDLQSIQSLLPSLPALPETQALVRVSLLLYPFFLICTHFIRLRILIAIVGTVLATYRAPWAIVLRSVLWRSAHLRWTIYHLWSHLSGQPMPGSVSHDVVSSSTKPVNTLRFLFTIYENQRWWMGLDWTAALLPGERPSWCSAAQHPVSPPNALSLPKSTMVTVSDAKGKRVMHTAMWRWEEPEWRLMVHRSDGGLSRVERPLPSMEKEGVNRLLKGKRRDSSPSTAAMPLGTDGCDDNPEDIDVASSDDPVTDLDGWVYGDNKWENQSNKGGMSKYTRYRRWTRIATVHEIVEPLHEYEHGDLRAESTDSLSSKIVDIDKSNEDKKSSPLRQRLMNALK